MSLIKKRIALAFLITCLFLIPSINIFSQNTSDKVWWQTIYEKGIVYLEQRYIAEAKLEFESILDRDDKCAEAYVGLGMVYDKENPGCLKAQNTLKKALRLNSDLAEAYYQLALVYEHTGTGLMQAQEYLRDAVKKDPFHVRAWIKRAQIAEAIRSPNPDVVQYYAEAVKHNLNNPELYALFIDAIFWHSQEKKGIDILQELIQSNPNSPIYLYDLARLYHAKEEYDMSQTILDSLKVTFPDFSQCRLDYLYAKNLFALNKINEALTHYLRGMSAIQDSADADAFFQDICYIMDDEEYEEFINTPVDSIHDFYLRFWQKRDPNLATEENERIAEHYQRLSYAYKEYRRYKIGRTAIDFMHETLHPMASVAHIDVQVGDDFIKDYLPKAIPEKRFFDDMGLIYIRHGKPDNWVFKITGGFEPQNMSWQYYSRYDYPELVFHFSKYGGSRGWTIESLPFLADNREEIDALYYNLQRAIERSSDFDMAGLGRQLIEKNKEYAEIGVKTETTEYTYEEKLLDFPFEWITFKGENGKILVELYYGIDGKNMEMETSEQSNYLSLSRFVGLYDENWREEVKINRDEKIPVQLTPEEWEKSSATEMESFQVSSGNTHFEVHLKDNLSDKLGLYKGIFQVDDYWQDSLMLSDILLSGPITPAEPNSSFQKADLAYTPHMFNGFEKNAVIGIYYELYNLTLNNQRKTQFKIEWTLRPEGLGNSEEDNRGFFARLFGGKKESVSTSYQYEGQNRDEPLYLNIDLRNKKLGQYELEVSATDLNNGDIVSKIVRFEIL